MRSQLLILLEKTPIVSIFATNVIQSYDPAFVSRLTTVTFSLPDEATRADIWAAHLPASLPMAADVSAAELSGRYPALGGRDICKAVIEAAFRAAIEGREQVEWSDFEFAAQRCG